MKAISLFTILFTLGALLFKGAESVYTAFDYTLTENAYSADYYSNSNDNTADGAMVASQLSLKNFLQPLTIFILSLGLPVFIILVLVFILCIAGLYQYIKLEQNK